MIAIAAIAMAFTQYVKGWIPEKAIRAVNLLAGVGAAYLCFYKPDAAVEWVKIIANGLIGAVGADLGFDFFSAKKSQIFSLSSKPEAPPKPKKEEKPIEIPPGLIEAVAAAIKTPQAGGNT
jgi:hypothetical protein